MDKFSVLKEYTSHLYRRAGQFNLYVCFHDGQGLNIERLKLEIENIKQTISSIENIIENQ